MIKKEKQFIKIIKNPFGDRICYIACFFVALFIICCIYILKKVVPFGNNTLLETDFYYQYSVMLAEIRDRFLSNSSKIYSFRSGLGLPLYRNFLNYVSSPLNIISLFFPREKFMMSFSFIIGLRAIFTSCFMLFYLNQRKGKNSFSNIPFAILYAFSGYFSCYYVNIMWMDSMMLIPLVAAGIDSIVKEKRWILYCSSLALTIFSNYYTGYMVCIFSSLYFLYSFFLNTTLGKINKKMLREVTLQFIKKGIIFCVASILAASLCITSLLLIKISLDTFDAANDLELFPKKFFFDINVKNILFSHFNGAHRTWFYSDSIIVPGIAVGVLPVFLIFAFITNKEISLKEKVLNIILMSFFLAALFIPQVDSILHGFHAPNDFPYRYAFMYSFILVMISAKSFDRLKGVSYLHVFIIFCALIGAFLWYGAQTNADEEVVLSADILIYNAIFLTIYTSVIVVAKNYNINKIVIFILIACTSVEIVTVYNDTLNIDQKESIFTADYNNFKPVIEWIEENDKEKFYRMEKLKYLSLNDGCWNRYNGVTIFSSMAYSGVSRFQQCIGLPGNGTYSYIYTDTSPLYNLLFDVKYVLNEFETDNSEYYQYYDNIKVNSKVINKFRYTAGIGFAVNKELMNLELKENNPFAFQNEIVKKSSDVDNDLFIPAEVTSKEIHKDENRTIIEYKIGETADFIYFYPNSYDIDFIKIGEKIYVEDLSNTLYINYGFLFPNIENENAIGNEDHGVKKIHTGGIQTSIYIAYTLDDFTNEPEFYTLNNDVFLDYYNQISDEKLEVVNFKEDCIDATIDLKDNSLVYTSIPYDKGWNVYVDGIKVEKDSFANAFLCFDVDEGKHDVRIKYKLRHRNGLLITNTFFVILFVALCIADKKYRKHINND